MSWGLKCKYWQFETFDSFPYIKVCLPEPELGDDLSEVAAAVAVATILLTGHCDDLGLRMTAPCLEATAAGCTLMYVRSELAATATRRITLLGLAAATAAVLPTDRPEDEEDDDAGVSLRCWSLASIPDEDMLVKLDRD